MKKFIGNLIELKCVCKRETIAVATYTCRTTNFIGPMDINYVRDLLVEIIQVDR